MRLVITGGGTGGHIYPAMAVAMRFAADPEYQVLFAGSAHGPEGAASAAAGIEFRGDRLGGVHGKNPLAAARALYLFGRATFSWIATFRRDRPDCVIGTGGYASAPACFAAAAARVPMVLIEPNVEPGIVVRVLSSRAGAVAVAFPETASRLKRGARVVVTGVPVRGEIEAVAEGPGREEARCEAAELFRLEKGMRTLLVFGGSQGAGALNEATWGAVAQRRVPPGTQVLHLTGRAAYESESRAGAESSARESGTRYRAVAYTERMDLAYAAADVAMCRSGAGTLAELQAARLPSVLVPYPYATDGHQETNARRYAAGGGAVVVEQSGGSAREAAEEALRLAADPAETEAMRSRLRALHPSTGTEGVAALVEELTYEHAGRNGEG